MTSVPLTAADRKRLKARAHALEPVVRIGDAGLTPAVMLEIERSLAAHELIKIRVAGEDRANRDAILDSICAGSAAQPVQHIGKLLVVYRAKDRPAEVPPIPAKKTPRATAARTKRNPVSGRLVGVRGAHGAPEPSTRKAVAGARPPRTARVRKSGQRSTKKPFQGS